MRHALTLLLLASVAGTAGGAIISRTKSVVVLQPGDLPVAAQQVGESMVLHEVSDGSTYLYIEQQAIKRIVALDVSCPGKIVQVGTVAIEAQGVFDFERNLGDKAVLVRYRGDGHVAVMDLGHPTRPAMVAADASLVSLEAQGGFAARQHVARNQMVVDSSNAAKPQILATVADVRQELDYSPTGTMYLLAADGLTVVRHPKVELEARPMR